MNTIYNMIESAKFLLIIFAILNGFHNVNAKIDKFQNTIDKFLSDRKEEIKERNKAK